MLDKILQIVAPHHCYSCQIIGTVLCDSCIYNIVNEAQSTCIECRQPCLNGICGNCRLPFSKAWVNLQREGELAKLIDDFKWSRVYEAHEPLSSILDLSIPLLPASTVIVPIPTISKHIRIRGYDHADLLASGLAKSRGLTKASLLSRKSNAVQHTASKVQRSEQAKGAFECNEQLDKDRPYLIVDDIVTTGSTIKAATRVLKRAGAQEIWVAAIVRQPV